MSRLPLVLAFLSTMPSAAILPAQSPSPVPPPADEAADWQATLNDRIERFGHRNWIAIVDSAYPAQASPGVETIVTGDDHLAVIKVVLARLAAYRHVRPIIYVDAELPYVAETDAAGIDAYRAALAQTLERRRAQGAPHAEIINRLDAAGEKFHVLVLKTNLALPYTSVFIELDCGYWSPEAEQRLRNAMEASAQ